MEKIKGPEVKQGTKKKGALIVALNEEKYVVASLLALQPLVHKIVVMLTTGEPWKGEKPEPDGTEDLLDYMSQIYDNIQVVKGEWSSEAEQRNQGLEMLQDCKGGIHITDGDEIVPSSTIHNIHKEAENRFPYSKAFLGINYTIWGEPDLEKGTCHRIDPPEGFKPVMFVHPDTRFRFARMPESGTPCLGMNNENDHAQWHFSYGYSKQDSKVLQKIRNFEHADEVVPQWLETVWHQWDPNDSDLNSNLHPTLSQSYQTTKKVRIHPDVLRVLRDAEKIKEKVL